MAQLVWSPSALASLAEICEYIGRDSEFYARAVATKIIQMARSIERFPWMGRVVPELQEEKIRERLVYSYRVVYQIQATRILIVPVIHGTRLIESISDRLKEDK